MNATKRKFNALLQGIGTRSASGSTPDKNDVAQAASTADAPSRTSRTSSRLTPEATPTKTIDTSTHDDETNMRFARSPLTSRVAAATTAAAERDAAASMSSTTTTGTSAAVAELELLAKRRRVGATSTLRDTSGNAATVLSTNSVLRKARQTTTTTTPSTTAITQPPMPRYCPGDREQLLRRLATFQELTDWTPKPDRINEIEWARRGWACQGKERVRCTLCSRELVVRLGRDAGTGDHANTSMAPPLTEAAGDALVDRYVGLIAAGHEDDCLWRRKGCDDSLLRLSLGSPRPAVAALRQRYDELCTRKDFLPYAFNLQLPAGLDIDAVVATLPPDFFNDPSASSSAASCNRVAFALALLGWQGLHNSRIGQVPNSASCHACLRRLGLWMFKSKQVDLASGTVLEPAPMDGLDPVREHRFFCPWKNGTVQRNPGARSGRTASTTTAAAAAAAAEGADSEPGWAVLVQVLRNDAYLRGRTIGAAVGGGSAASPAQPSTPVRRRAVTNDGAVVTTPTGHDDDDDDNGDDQEDEAARVAKDKERWARLRRVKSLFDPKGQAARKLKRSGTLSQPGTPSRPGTSQAESKAE
ncbi:c3hc zinc finger protein [Grosmannia clavigera kw1407]|uniref:C3hc zinc finger protein n=1 Tax=Grosmannia clavigera (strain kw1407 / UAMH 11150) TaxID=655863 RepID=F0X9N1_GROCL|nr:c3hc zinc finger protein [Grosmannia clavigera kw1407]EFX05234.1 c3hc zinc finger protein [Grosmannia clavigera kw1407]